MICPPVVQATASDSVRGSFGNSFSASVTFSAATSFNFAIFSTVSSSDGLSAFLLTASVSSEVDSASFVSSATAPFVPLVSVSVVPLASVSVVSLVSVSVVSFVSSLLSSATTFPFSTAAVPLVATSSVGLASSVGLTSSATGLKNLYQKMNIFHL